MQDFIDVITIPASLIQVEQYKKGKQMRDDLVKRLRFGIVEHRKRWSGDTHGDLGGSVDYDATTDMLFDAADRIEELEAKLAEDE